MAKKIYRLRDWSGGLNTFKEPGELKENELVAAYGHDTSNVGRIRSAGHFMPAASAFPGGLLATTIGRSSSAKQAEGG